MTDAAKIASGLRGAGYNDAQIDAMGDAFRDIDQHQQPPQYSPLALSNDMKVLENRLTLKLGTIVVAAVAAVSMITKFRNGALIAPTGKHLYGHRTK